MSLFLQISPETRFHRLAGSFALESGERLRGVEIAYRTWGELAPERDNAVVVVHALTGSADVDRWWGKLLGPGRAFDPASDFVLSANLLGSCYGTTGPASPRAGPTRAPEDSPGSSVSRERWGPAFPAITIRDQARLLLRLLDALGIGRLRFVVGGSLGGMVAIELALLDRGRVDALGVLQAPGRHGPWAIAFSELARRALALDPRFRDGHYPADDPPDAGLALARSIAMTSYRSRESFDQRFGRDRREERFEVERYLEHQGRKLAARFDANSYRALLGAMDRHDVGRGRGTFEGALRSLDVPALVLSCPTDVLYPEGEQLELAAPLPRSGHVSLASLHGHDAFLIEQETVGRILTAFRRRVAAGEVGDAVPAASERAAARGLGLLC
jgi:homoserine O-acetyltransferase